MFTVVCITAVILMPLRKSDSWLETGDEMSEACAKVALPICCGLFFMAVFGKDTMQMKVTKYSSAMTRKLLQQFYPSGTWCLSLFAYYVVANKFGRVLFYFVLFPCVILCLFPEKWMIIWSWMQLLGFMIVFWGTYWYMKPSVRKAKKRVSISRSHHAVGSVQR